MVGSIYGDKPHIIVSGLCQTTQIGPLSERHDTVIRSVAASYVSRTISG